MIEEYFAELTEQLPQSDLSWDEVKRAYAGRAYHNLDHLDEMLGHLSHNRAPEDTLIFGIALVYHDIVYKPTRRDNEERSAKAAVKKLRSGSPLAEGRIARCRQLILATKHHQPSTTDEGDEALLIDLDLAVLAREPTAYDRYAAAIRREFWMVPGFVFRSQRNKALTTLLDREHIYHTGYGREHYETRARENLWRELRNS